MISNPKETIDTFSKLKENQELLTETLELATAEEDKTSSAYLKVKQELEEIGTDISSIFSESEQEELVKNSEIQNYLDHLDNIIEASDDIEVKRTAERQSLMIRSSYTFEIFNELTTTMKSDTILRQYNTLKNKAEYKLDNNDSFTFLPLTPIEDNIRSVLPDRLKNKAKITAGFIYAFIMTASLKPDGHAMFVFFLIRNITHLDTKFAEKNALINNLIKLTENL